MKVDTGELSEYVDLVARFYAEHGRDPNDVETSRLVTLARLYASGNGRCPLCGAAGEHQVQAVVPRRPDADQAM